MPEFRPLTRARSGRGSQSLGKTSLLFSPIYVILNKKKQLAFREPKTSGRDIRCYRTDDAPFESASQVSE